MGMTNRPDDFGPYTAYRPVNAEDITQEALDLVPEGWRLGVLREPFDKHTVVWCMLSPRHRYTRSFSTYERDLYRPGRAEFECMIVTMMIALLNSEKANHAAE